MKLNETIIVGLLIAFCFSTQAFALSDQEVRENLRKEKNSFTLFGPTNARTTTKKVDVIARGVLFYHQVDLEYDELATREKPIEAFHKRNYCKSGLYSWLKVNNVELIHVYDDRHGEVVIISKVDKSACQD
jgi:hypothetical protein